jgi:hypothetical protein
LQSIGYFRTHFIDRRRRTDLATAVPILAGFFGALARARFFAHRYCAMAAASATMVVVGTRPMNTKIMWRRVIDQPLFHLANDRQSIVIFGTFVGGTDLPFQRPLQGLAPALVDSEHHRGRAVVALALMCCEVLSKVLPDLA